MTTCNRSGEKSVVHKWHSIPEFPAPLAFPPAIRSCLFLVFAFPLPLSSYTLSCIWGNSSSGSCNCYTNSSRSSGGGSSRRKNHAIYNGRSCCETIVINVGGTDEKGYILARNDRGYRSPGQATNDQCRSLLLISQRAKQLQSNSGASL